MTNATTNEAAAALARELAEAKANEDAWRAIRVEREARLAAALGFAQERGSKTYEPVPGLKVECAARKNWKIDRDALVRVGLEMKVAGIRWPEGLDPLVWRPEVNESRAEKLRAPEHHEHYARLARFATSSPGKVGVAVKFEEAGS